MLFSFCKRQVWFELAQETENHNCLIFQVCSKGLWHSGCKYEGYESIIRRFVNCFFSALAKGQTDKIKQDKESTNKRKSGNSMLDWLTSLYVQTFFIVFVTSLLIDKQYGVLLQYCLALYCYNAFIGGLKWYPLPHNGSLNHVLLYVLQTYFAPVFGPKFRARGL